MSLLPAQPRPPGAACRGSTDVLASCLVVVAALVLTPSTPTLAACSSFGPLSQAEPATDRSSPSVLATTTTTTTLFRGFMGEINVPFPVPGVAKIRIGRGTCKAGGAAFQNGARTIVVIKPSMAGATKGVTQAFILGDANACTPDIIKACDEGIDKSHSGEVSCFPLTASQYKIAPGALDIDQFPDPGTADPAGNILATHAGPVTIAVTSHSPSDLTAVCKSLATDNCTKAVNPTDSNWHACIDELFDSSNNNCGTAKKDVADVFSNLTLLPTWNDLSAACFWNTQYCDGAASATGRLRYAVDVGKNILVPMYWYGSLKRCTTPEPNCGLMLTGALDPSPRTIDIPDNDTTSTMPSTSTTVPGTTTTTLPSDRNTFLQSYMPDGIRIDGASFGRAQTGAILVIGLNGRTDDYYSVLRLAANFGVCTKGNSGGSLRRCAEKRDCNKGEKCTQLFQLHDQGDAFNNGEWSFDRADGTFCEQQNQVGLPCTSSCKKCVRYQLTAGPEVYVHKPKDSCRVPRERLAQLLEVLEKETGPLGAESLHGAEQCGPDKGDIFAASDSSEQGIAVYLRDPSIRAALHCPDGQAAALVVAKRNCNEQTLSEVSCPDVGQVDVNEGLSVLGSKVRFFAPDPETKDSGRDKLLRVYDIRRGVLTSVARVDTSDDRYSALVDYPNGATLFLSPAARCFVNDDPVPVPSFCTPGADTSECPSGSTCKPTTVVVATDLTTDRDDDGVPDAVAASAHSSR